VPACRYVEESMGAVLARHIDGFTTLMSAALAFGLRTRRKRGRTGAVIA